MSGGGNPKGVRYKLIVEKKEIGFLYPGYFIFKFLLYSYNK